MAQTFTMKCETSQKKLISADGSEVKDASDLRITYKLRNTHVDLMGEDSRKLGRLYLASMKFIETLAAGTVKDLAEYDEDLLSSDAVIIHKFRAAVCRLEHPLELREEYKKKYTALLKKHAALVLPVLIRKGEIAAISILAGLGAIPADQIDDLIDQAGKQEKLEILATLMDYKNAQCGSASTYTLELTENKPLDDWEFDENEDGTLTITRYRGSLRDVTIPAVIDGRRVRRVEGHSLGSVMVSLFFTNKDNIEQVDIEDGIEEIGERAFLECRNLKCVVIPESVKEIGREAFSGCEQLESIAIPYGLMKIGIAAFEGCQVLKEVSLPASVEVIERDAFSNTPFYKNHQEGSLIAGAVFLKYKGNAKSIIVPPGIKTIYYSAFAGTQVSTVELPDGLEYIFDNAFENCSSLESINIPSSVKQIGKLAFSGCKSLRSLVIPDHVTILQVGVFSECVSLVDVHLSKNLVVMIEENKRPFFAEYEYEYDGAFKNCENLLSINIPQGVQKIPGESFRGCKLLSSIQLPKNLMEIGKGAFDGCSNLVSISIPNCIKLLGSRAFNGCASLTSINIPDSVTKIGSYAFSGCTGLTSITIPNSVTKIGSHAFSGCTGLTSLTIPDSVTGIDSNAFYCCTGLTSITIPDSVTEIGDHAFYGCTGLTSIMIPDSVTKIGYKAFTGCTGLTSIMIQNNVTEIESNAFDGCDKLVIHAPIDSYALKYAKENKINFVEI